MDMGADMDMDMDTDTIFRFGSVSVFFAEQKIILGLFRNEPKQKMTFPNKPKLKLNTLLCHEHGRGHGHRHGHFSFVLDGLRVLRLY
jgi:hypothetical protein